MIRCTEPGTAPIFLAWAVQAITVASCASFSSAQSTSTSAVDPGVINTFTNVSSDTGIGGSGYAVWVDYNQDGNVDVATGGKLWRNNGDGTFEMTDLIASSDGVWGDYDNDGLLDMYDIGGQGRLIRQVAPDKFESAAIPPNTEAHSRAAAWGDADNDGNLDLYVSNYETWPANAFADFLYINQGDGTFAEPIAYPDKWKWRGRGVNWSDFDNDGDQDIYVSNYRLMPNQLWVNDGTGKFTDEAKARGVLGTDDEAHIPAGTDTPLYNASGHTIGSCFGDVNNDGHIDLIVVNFAHPPALQDRTMVCINSGPPDHTFTNINAGDKAGIHWQESYAKGALGDFDNDGDLDLYITTVYSGNNGTLFENDGTGNFKDVGDATGTRGGNGYGIAWADYDNDGDLDLHVGGRLMRNNGNNNAWVKVKAIGNGASNAAAIGARITITAGDKQYLREVQAGNSGNQNPLIAHIGLGNHTGPVDIAVRFPSGKTVTVRSESRETVVVREESQSRRQGRVKRRRHRRAFHHHRR